jgi:hypothetical protein
VRRGVIEAPEAIGEQLGWLRIEEEQLSTVLADSGDAIQGTTAPTAAYA